ncbi:ribonuclease E, partial [Pseudoalteromonas sp. S3178]
VPNEQPAKVEEPVANEQPAKVEEPVATEQPAKVETVANAKTVIVKGAASAPMAQPTPVADSEVKHTSVAMAHDKRDLVPDSGLRAGSVKPAGRASSAMTKTMSAD